MNETVDIVQSKEGWSLWEMDCLLYAAQISLAELNKQYTSGNVLTERRKKSETLDNPNTKEMLNLRKWTAWVATTLEMRNRVKNLQRNKRTTSIELKESTTPAKHLKLKEIKET